MEKQPVYFKISQKSRATVRAWLKANRIGCKTKVLTSVAPVLVTRFMHDFVSTGSSYQTIMQDSKYSFYMILLTDADLVQFKLVFGDDDRIRMTTIRPEGSNGHTHFAY